HPLADGMVTIFPADGKGPTLAGRIVNGRYKVEKVQPGPKIIKVEAVRSINFKKTSEEMAQFSASARNKGDRSGIVERADIVPENAEGNNAPYTVESKDQTIDLRLKKPHTK